MRALVSLISTGTELVALHNRYPPGSHWAERVCHPFRHAGYALVGEIIAVGAGVSSERLGERKIGVFDEYP